MRREKAKKRLSRRYFSKWAHKYDESILQHLVFRSSHNMLFNEIDNIHKGAKLKILDVGCGTGELVYKLANHFRDSEVHGLDISKTMIEKANIKTKKDNIKFEIGDVEELPYEDNAFDVVTCSHSFHHYPDKEKAISEMYRVLRPQGKVMIIDGCRDVLVGRIIFDLVGMIEKHVYHLFAKEFKEVFKRYGFENIVQKRFNIVPLLLTIGTAAKKKGIKE